MTDTKTCMTDGCDNTRYGRGLCVACYTAARRMVSEEKTTWEELIKLGLSAKVRPGKRSRFYRSFETRIAIAKAEGGL